MITIHDWSSLGLSARRALLERPQAAHADLGVIVRDIIARVRRDGDDAVRSFTRQFDRIDLQELLVDEAEHALAEAQVTDEANRAMRRAADNIRRFHDCPRPPVRIDTSPGVFCERVDVPIQSVGLYVPAGSAPLPSTALMLGIPATLAGCPNRLMCTPPRADGRADPFVLVAARIAGVRDVYKIGGAQAIAAMAYGTASVPKVDKIFGPGNAFVTEAKLHVARDPSGAALDMPAGPSEVMVIADHSADPRFVAADLLAQAEHDPSSQAMLVTTDHTLATRVLAELSSRLSSLTRSGIVRQALQASCIIKVRDLGDAIAIANAYAPEHLIIETSEPRALLPGVTTAGSVFLGHWSPESIGDYCSGPNHVLPTYGYARAYSGLSVSDFTRRMTVQELTPDGLRDLGPSALVLAGLEGLDAHAEAVRVRLTALERA